MAKSIFTPMNTFNEVLKKYDITTIDIKGGWHLRLMKDGVKICDYFTKRCSLNDYKNWYSLKESTCSGGLDFKEEFEGHIKRILDNIEL